MDLLGPQEAWERVWHVRQEMRRGDARPVATHPAPEACPVCGDQTNFAATDPSFTHYVCGVCRSGWEVSRG